MIVTVPRLTAVASPVLAPMVAIDWLLEPHVAELVTSTVDPVAVVSMAWNWAVSPTIVTNWVFGIIAIDNGPPCPPELPETMSVAAAETTPVNPLTLAVIVVVPAETPVAMPLALIIATPGALEVQVAEAVRSCEVEGCLFPWPKTPVAVNCTVWPAPMDCVVGDTEIETANGLVQPAIGSAKAIRRSSRGDKTRSCMVDLWSLQTALTLIEDRHCKLSLACMPSTIGHVISAPQSHEGVTFGLASRQSISASALTLNADVYMTMVTCAASQSPALPQ